MSELLAPAGRRDHVARRGIGVAAAHARPVRAETRERVLEAARVKGLRVPEDLSVVGYDDVPLAQWSSPPLTTVHQPLRSMAEEAARMLLRPDDPGTAAQRIELATRLVVRQSTAAPRNT